MRFTREQYLNLMTFGHADRPMFSELFGPLVGLPEEWRAQGASEDEINMVAFDWDYVDNVYLSINHPVGLPPGRVIEDTPEYRVERDGYGRTTKLCKSAATIPLPLDYPVKNMDDWLRLKPHFLFHPSRVDVAALAKAKAARADGALVVAHIFGGFNSVRELMGEEGACLAYYDAPELVRDILQTLGDCAEEALEKIARAVALDQLSAHEDLAGKSGPLPGPSQVREFIAPYYRRAWDVARSGGARIFQQDSDGNVTAVIDAFLDAGLTCMYPMEPAAGMDIVDVRKQYGKRLAMLGGIDKHVLRGTKEDIRRELERKLIPELRTGHVFGLDHRIPNGTPLDNYRYYVDLGREMLGIPPRSPERRGWSRMAF